MEVDVVQAEAWARREQDPRWVKAGSFLRFWWYQILPRLVRSDVNVWRLFFLFWKIVALLLIVASPIWIDFYEKAELKLRPALGYIAILVVAMVYAWLYDMFGARKIDRELERNEERLVSLRLSDAVNKFGGIVRAPSAAVQQTRRDEIVDDLLICIQHKTRVHLGQYDESFFQATLLVYPDSQGDELLIKSRALPTLRKVGVTVKASRSAANYVARAGRDWKAIHDLKNDKLFPYEGLSDNATPPYRSVMFLPILRQEQSGNGSVCLGVISIDAARPYEFWGTNGTDLTDQLIPYVQMIGLLLDNQTYGIQI